MLFLAGRGARPETTGSKANQVNKQIRRSYNENFKIMVINEAEGSNNLRAAKKFHVAESNVRRWRKEKDRLRDANHMRKAFRGPKKGR